MNAPTSRPQLRALLSISRARVATLPWGRSILLGAMAAALLGSPALAQEETDEVEDPFGLDEGVAMEVPFEPGIEANSWEISIQFGYFDLDHSMFEAKGLVADLESPDEMIFADTEFYGELGFCPQLRFSRTFGKHLAFENSFGTSFGDFTQRVVAGTLEKWTDPGGNNELSETEIEKGSYFALMHDHALTYYPRGDGRIQPYITAGIGTQWYEIDTDYIDGMAGGFAFSYGGGLRVITDDLYSFRLDVRNYHTSITYDVKPVWRIEQNLAGDALVGIPVVALVDTFDRNGDVRFTPEELEIMFARIGMPVPDPLPQRLPAPVTEFDSIDYSNLYISLGFTASF